MEGGTTAMYGLRSTRTNTGKIPSTVKKNDETEKLLNQAVEVGNEMRKQIDEMKQLHDKECTILKQELDKMRQDSVKEKSELQRKIKDVTQTITAIIK